VKRIDRSRQYLNLKTSAEVVNDVVNSAKIQVTLVQAFKEGNKQCINNSFMSHFLKFKFDLNTTEMIKFRSFL